MSVASASSFNKDSEIREAATDAFSITFSSAEILDPGRINILLMFEIVIGITSAALLTEEIIGIREVIGATLIIIAGSIDLIKFKS